MQLDFLDGLIPCIPQGKPGTVLPVNERLIPLEFTRNSRARHYILRLTPEGTARVTIPWGGSNLDALAFARSKVTWLARQLERIQRRRQSQAFDPGSRVLFRGAWNTLEVGVHGGRQFVRFAGADLPLRHGLRDLQEVIETHLRELAVTELPPRVLALASEHRVAVRQVQIRAQRSRWGSCSSRGTISLNWRLVQIPGWVSDYLIIHELMHLREMNHSARYWAHVAAACPRYEEAEAWLKQHGNLLRS